MPSCLRYPFGAMFAALFFATVGEAAEGDTAFFENQVRPILAKRCYECHSSEAKRVKGGLRLDHTALIRAGGDSGTILAPEGLLLEAIRYQDVDLQMPPDSRLPAAEIAVLEAWIANGAPMPEDSHPVDDSEEEETFDLEARKAKGWAWRPITRPEIPAVEKSDWPQNPIDHFILKGLEDAGFQPADRAPSSVLARRLSFDLNGLPPDDQELAGLEDSESVSKRIESQLRRPAFGETWARHWLDLVRYAETMGHEFDYAIPSAWRYRDYVIRAFNEDLPYDQFVREHLAGDQIPNPRLDSEGRNQSVIGVAFYWLGQQVHSPVDVLGNQSDLLANQIDVLTKTFLGMTVACARCHDHKFDPIPTQDFYSLYGILSSSRYHPIDIDPDTPRAERRDRMRRLHGEMESLASAALLDEASAIKTLWPLVAQLTSAEDPKDQEPDTLKAWAAEVLGERGNESQRARVLDIVGKIREGGTPLARVLRAFLSDSPPTDTQWSFPEDAHILLDPEQMESDASTWFFHDEAFRDQRIAEAGALRIGDRAQPLEGMLVQAALDSRMLSKRIEGSVSSPTFRIARRYAHVLVSGRDARVNLVVENHNLIRAPIYGGLKKKTNSDAPQWMTFDLDMWRGNDAYLQLNDMVVADLAGPGSRPEAWFSIHAAYLTDERTPPSPTYGLVERLRNASTDSLVRAAELTLSKEPEAWEPSDRALIDGFLRLGLLRGASETLIAKAEEFQQIQSSIRPPSRIPGMTEGTPVDESIFIRGNPRSPGAIAPRMTLAALGATGSEPHPGSTGRMELADSFLDRDNPLTARVYVNRVWSRLFGRGLAPTPDDFGEMGQEPTHPDLLDWLADWFRTEGQWSTKALIRLITESATYQMASTPRDWERFQELDPTNALLSFMPLRRLSAEAIRDAILKVSGSLNPELGGGSVPTHLTAFMQGRGRPGRNGPLDGEGRRSVYLEVRRNFLAPMMEAFDRPIPSDPVGQRARSNVPAQALMLLNDPFVHQQARRWAAGLGLHQPNFDGRAAVTSVYRNALGRDPTSAETDACLAFVETQDQALTGSKSENREQAWADLLHVVLNLKEFIYLN